MQSEYRDFLSDIIRKGYAEKVPPEDLKPESGSLWCIPHHGVYHKRKKNLCVVFNCTSTFKGTSLNSVLLQGPDLANSLIGVLLRFRQEPVAIMADMFHQVRVKEEDRNFLRFLWWPEGDTNKPLEEYRMTVLLFGAVSSPACAQSSPIFMLMTEVSSNREASSKSCKEPQRNVHSLRIQADQVG